MLQTKRRNKKMLVYIINTSAGVLTLPYDTDKIDTILRIIDALSVVVFDSHPSYVTLNY